MDKPITQPSPPFILSTKTAFNQVAALVGRVTKRGMDIFAALLALVLLSPVFAIVAVLIKRDSPGPVFYRGCRVGRNGREFAILKFRTMKECPESYRGPRVTAQDDPRITRFGRRLRRAKINELPQLWNVLKGEMSLVGPRPFLPEQAKMYGRVLDLYVQVRPGITGLWQVNGRNRLSFQQRVDCDLAYFESWSLLLDISILVRTPLAVLSQRGAY